MIADPNILLLESMGRTVTPLMLAVKVKSLPLAKKFISLNADVNARDFHPLPEDGRGRTALHYAIEVESLPIAKFLIKSGANIDAVDSRGWTPLAESVFNKNIRMTEFLLAAGANPKVKNRRLSLLNLAIESDDQELITLILRTGCDFQQADEFGKTPLMQAAGHHNLLAVKQLCALGADVNAKDKKGYTPLMRACLAGPKSQPEVVRYLLKSGAKKWIKNDSGMNAIAIAKRSIRSLETPKYQKVFLKILSILEDK